MKDLWWEIIGLILGIGAFFLGEKYGQNIWIGIFSGFLTYVGVLILRLRYEILPLFHSTINTLIECNPLLVNKMHVVVNDALSLKEKRGAVLDFSIKSIQKMIDDHFIIVYQGINDYQHTIETLCKLSHRSIHGTSTYRPKFSSLAPDKPHHVRQSEISRRLLYLRMLLDIRCPEKCRIVILSAREIKDIITECIKSITHIRNDQKPDSSKNIKGRFNDIPEIEWFVTKVNGNVYAKVGVPESFSGQSFKLFWAEHATAAKASVTYNHLVVDGYRREPQIDEYAVFDREVLVKYSFVDDWNAGALFMSWGRQKIERYYKPFDDLMKDPSDPDDRIYQSFYDLVFSYPWDAQEDVLSFDEVHLQIFNGQTPVTAYQKLIDLFGIDAIEFEPSYVNTYSRKLP